MGSWVLGRHVSGHRVFVPAVLDDPDGREGLLIIDVINANTKKLVWRSIARAEHKDFRKPENIEKAVDKALQKNSRRRARDEHAGAANFRRRPDVMDRGLSTSEQKQLAELLGKLHAGLTAE